MDNKELYLNIMEKCFREYAKTDFEAMDTFDIQSYSRVVCVLGALISNGRCMEQQALWEEMMGRACRDIVAYKHDLNASFDELFKGMIDKRRQDTRSLERSIMVDFSVKELMIAYRAMKGKASK